MDIPRIKHLLHESCQLSPSDRLVVGVSGGADSLALLELLLELGYNPVVAHLDHRLRPSSSQEAAFVEKFAAMRSLECAVGRADVSNYAREERLSIEEAARIKRYRFLFFTARQKHARAVLTAHTADDQVETVLMHLLRGSGLHGLQGMALVTTKHGWDDGIPLVRPLLDTWKSEILDYCRVKGLEPVLDESNLDKSYLRNRIRADLIPYLQTYNREIKAALLRLSANARQEIPVIDAAVENAWQDCLLLQSPAAVHLSVVKISNYRKGIQAGVIRRAVGGILDDLSDLDQAGIQRALSFIHKPLPDRRIEITGGILLFLLEDRLVITRDSGFLQTDKPLLPERYASGVESELSVPGVLLLENGWRLTAKMVTPEENHLHCDNLQAYLDAEKLELPLTVRSRRPGDRFSPFGLAGGTVKLSDFMINEKIPGLFRRQWPLVCSGGEIVWVAGYRQAEHTRVEKDTGRIVHLYLHK